MTAVKGNHYLKGSLDATLKYKKSEDSQLIGYTDADNAGDLDDRHSTTGNRFLMSGGPVSWFSRKQRIVTLSAAEANTMTTRLRSYVDFTNSIYRTSCTSGASFA